MKNYFLPIRISVAHNLGKNKSVIFILIYLSLTC